MAQGGKGDLLRIDSSKTYVNNLDLQTIFNQGQLIISHYYVFKQSYRCRSNTIER